MTDQRWTMPKPPSGFASCRVHDGSGGLLPVGVSHQVTHLVFLDAKGSNGGRPTVCGLTRFDTRDENGEVVRQADLPGWSMGGGIYGPEIEQIRCFSCWEGPQ